MYPQYPKPQQRPEDIFARTRAVIAQQDMIKKYKQREQLTNAITWIGTLVIIGMIIWFTATNWKSLSQIGGKTINQAKAGLMGSTNTSPIDCQKLLFASDGGLKQFPNVGSKWCIAEENRANWLLYNNDATINALAQEIANRNPGSNKDAIAQAIKLSFATFVIDLNSTPALPPIQSTPTTAMTIPTSTPLPAINPTSVPTPTSTPPTITEVIQSSPTPITVTSTSMPQPTKIATPTQKPIDAGFNINLTPDEHPVIPVSKLKDWAVRWNIPFVVISSDDLVTRGNRCVNNQIASWPVVEFQYNKGPFDGFGYFYVDFTELQNLGYRSTMNGCPGFFRKYFIGDKDNVGFWDVAKEFGMYFAPWKKGPSILP